jgi:hypothetical protein
VRDVPAEFAPERRNLKTSVSAGGRHGHAGSSLPRHSLFSPTHFSSKLSMGKVVNPYQCVTSARVSCLGLVPETPGYLVLMTDHRSQEGSRGPLEEAVELLTGGHRYLLMLGISWLGSVAECA